MHTQHQSPLNSLLSQFGTLLLIVYVLTMSWISRRGIIRTRSVPQSIHGETSDWIDFFESPDWELSRRLTGE
jgi:hypothetical protein